MVTALAGNRITLSDAGDPLKRRNYVKLLGAQVNLTGIDPRLTGATALVGRPGAGSPLALAMPAEGWTKRLSKVTDYRFSSRTGPVRSARLIEGKLVLVSAKGLGAYSLGTPQGTVGVVVDVGMARFCGLFGGTISTDNGQRFQAREAPAPPTCPELGAP